jgi:hypothetical protein
MSLLIILFSLKQKMVVDMEGDELEEEKEEKDFYLSSYCSENESQEYGQRKCTKVQQ